MHFVSVLEFIQKKVEFFQLSVFLLEREKRAELGKK